jgi:hypothetical protein
LIAITSSSSSGDGASALAIDSALCSGGGDPGDVHGSEVQLGMEDPGKRDYSMEINDPFGLDRDGSDDQWSVEQDRST